MYFEQGESNNIKSKVFKTYVEQIGMKNTIFLWRWSIVVKPG